MNSSPKFSAGQKVWYFAGKGYPSYKSNEVWHDIHSSTVFAVSEDGQNVLIMGTNGTPLHVSDVYTSLEEITEAKTKTAFSLGDLVAGLAVPSEGYGYSEWVTGLVTKVNKASIQFFSTCKGITYKINKGLCIRISANAKNVADE